MTAQGKPVAVTKPPSVLRASLISGVVGGVIGAVLSGLVNYAMGDVPDSVAANAFNHTVTGLISGFTAGFFGLLVHLRKASSTARAEAPDQASPSPQKSVLSTTPPQGEDGSRD